MKKKFVIVLLIMFIFIRGFQYSNLTSFAQAETFNNPVIWADVPDPSVIRVGENYYMSSTTMHMSPGLPIMKSQDLVNWEIVNYVYDILETGDKQSLRNGQNEYGQGSWASSLRYNDGTYYVAVASFSSGKTYLFQTDDIEKGEWSRSTLDGVYHDMSLLFDDDGRVYMVYGGGDIQLVELNEEVTAIKENGLNKTIIHDACSIAGINGGLAAEGAHIQKVNGYYYIFLITWPEGDMRTQLVYRSNQIDGDYEGRVALRDEGIAQGGIADTVNGDWYGFLFGDRGSVGRIPYLVPVTWEDNWPIFGVDGKVPTEMKLPVQSHQPIRSIVASDEFYYPQANRSSLPALDTDLQGQEANEANQEIIGNGQFEDGLNPWVGNGGALVQVSGREAAAGNQSLFISGRKATGDGPKQFLTGKIKTGKVYQISAKVKYTEGPDRQTFNFNIQNGPSWQGIEVIASTTVNRGEWGTIEGTYTLPEEEADSTKFIFIETPLAEHPDPKIDLIDFYVDDVSITDIATVEVETEGEYEGNDSKLPLVWQWNHNPDHNNWSLTERTGYLRLRNGRLSANLVNARNTLTQRTFGPVSSGQIAIDVSQMKNGDVAGLAAFQANYGYVGVTMKGNQKSLIMAKATQDNGEEVLESIPLGQDRVYLKADLDFTNQIDQARFYYSLDGIEWVTIGQTLQMSYTLPHFMGYRFGLFNYGSLSTGGYVDFDYFRVSDQITGTQQPETILYARIDEVVEITDQGEKEIQVPIRMDSLPEGDYSSLIASVKIPYGLSVMDVDFNLDNIDGDATYTFSNHQLIIRLEGENVGFTHRDTDQFVTLHLKTDANNQVNQVENLRVDYIDVSGDQVTYNTHEAVVQLTLTTQMQSESKDYAAGELNPLYPVVSVGAIVALLGVALIVIKKKNKGA
ncbi:family 43 glycosylhydrolase [Amphibacillus indicireducens]|uniref:Family 43 glycosylhydrolase n=1 Tax=Amphibacillus indicireducens TaxID=1076330 RepID=A0ABP7V797_9BACI